MFHNTLQTSCTYSQLNQVNELAYILGVQCIPPLKKKNGSGIAQSDFEKAEEFNGQLTSVFTFFETVHNQAQLLDRSAPFMREIVVTKEGVTKLLKVL